MATQAEAGASLSVTPDTGYSPSYQRKAVLLLMVIYAFSYLDRYIMNILAEPIKIELGLADWQIGLMTGLAFSVCYSLAGIPIARYADKGDRPKIITIAILVWSAATAISGFVQNFAQMLIARILVGVGEAGCTPPAHSLISEYVPEGKRALAIAIYSLALPIGTILGMSLGGLIADSFGWRWAFIIVGAPGLLLAALAYFFLREPRREAEAAMAAKAAVEPLSQALGNLWKVPTFRWTTIAVAILSVSMYGAVAFQASFFLRNHAEVLDSLAATSGLGSLSLLGIILGLGTGLAALIGTFLGGYLADMWRSKGDGSGILLLPAISCLFAGPLLAASFLANNFYFAVGLVSLSFVFIASWVGPVYAAVHSVVPASSRATSSAIILMAGSLVGMTIGPFLVGAISDVLNLSVGLGSSQGLKWALVTVSMLFLISAPMLWHASRQLKNDVLS